MAEINTESMEYYTAVLFVQAVAEDGHLSEEEAVAVEEALGGFYEGLETDADAGEYLTYIADEISENTDSYLESLEEALKFFAEQKKDLRAGILELMQDLAGADGVSAKEKKFFQSLKSAWGL